MERSSRPIRERARTEDRGWEGIAGYARRAKEGGTEGFSSAGGRLGEVGKEGPKVAAVRCENGRAVSGRRRGQGFSHGR